MYHLSRKEQKMLRRILLSAALLILCKVLPFSGFPAAVCYLIPYLLVGWDVLY